MTEATESPAKPTSSLKEKRGTLLFVGAALFVVAMFGYMEKIPAVLHWPVRILWVGAILYLAYAVIRWVVKTKFEAKKVIFSLVLAAFFYLALHLICAVFIKLMSVKDEALTTAKTESLSEKARKGVNLVLEGNSPSLFDVDVGWVPRPDFEWKMHKIGPQGIRGTKVYPETPADPEKRILCIGDSFTFGYEVEDDEAYPAVAEQLVPGTEWINLGICGGGLTQSYLHYKKNGTKFGGKYVVIGFMTNNNKRTVNCFRAFISPDDGITPLTKPFAKLADGEFSIEPNPYQDVSDYEKLLADEPGELAKLYETDYYTWSNQRSFSNPVMRTLLYVWNRREGDRNLDILLNREVKSYRRPKPGEDPYGRALWHPGNPGFQCNAWVFDQYVNEVIADGREPLIVMLPSARDVEERAKGRAPRHAALLEYFDEKGYRYLDFLDSLEEHRKGRMTQEDLYGRTHLNAETNRLLAEEIVKELGLK